jgi:hypothetical protein
MLKSKFKVKIEVLLTFPRKIVSKKYPLHISPVFVQGGVYILNWGVSLAPQDTI